MESKNLYKLIRIPSLADALAKRSQNIIAERQEKRREFFWGSRIDVEQSPVADKNQTKSKKLTRAEMLKKWKAERMKKQEEDKKKQKPIFKVGVVQRKATGSPAIIQPKTTVKKITAPAQQTQSKIQFKKPQTKNLDIEKQGVLTRAKAKNLGIKAKPTEVQKATPKKQNKFYKIEAGKKKQVGSHVFKVPETVARLSCKSLTFPCSPKIRKSIKTPIKQTESKADTTKIISVSRNEVKLTSKIVMEQLQESVEVENKPIKMNSLPEILSPEQKENKGDDYQPIVYSPFVTVRSGRKSKRNSKKSLTLNVDEQIQKEESELKCRIFSFRKYIEGEKKRLLETCERWRHIYQEFQEVPTDVEGDIDSVVGKTNLLTSDKFMQFKGLIDKCENGDPFIKIDDLQGFQDWVAIEVERIDDEFSKLEKRKRNNWKSETVAVDVSKPQKVKTVKNCRKKPVASSNIRSHILAARKRLNVANTTENSQIPVVALEIPVKAVTPKKENLLKEVLNSETKRRNESFGMKSPAVKNRRNSGLEIMIATQKNKFPTPVKLQKSPLLTDFEIIVGKEETPSKSILKKTPKISSSRKGRVTFKKHAENLANGGQGLDEKYFQPLAEDDMSPARTILGDLGNLTPAGMKTRSRSRLMSISTAISPRVN